MDEVAARVGVSRATWHRRAGSTVAEGWTLLVTPESAGWQYSGLRIAELPPGGRVEFVTGCDERQQPNIGTADASQQVAAQLLHPTAQRTPDVSGRLPAAAAESSRHQFVGSPRRGVVGVPSMSLRRGVRAGHGRGRTAGPGPRNGARWSSRLRQLSSNGLLDRMIMCADAGVLASMTGSAHIHRSAAWVAS